MATVALVDIEQVVSRYLLKYKLSTDDYFIYLEHACDCFKHFRLYDSDQVETLKIAVSVNKIIEMPTDMQTFVDLYIPLNGQWWSFSERKYIVNTTTFTGLVEGRDADAGEGVDLTDPRTTGYGASGGVNDYNYMLDWEARRIFVDGISDDTVVLAYTSSGIEVSGTTQIPDMLIPMIDAYLRWKSSYWLPELARERQLLEKDYNNERLSIRNLINSMSYSQWRDVILSGVRQSPKR